MPRRLRQIYDFGIKELRTIRRDYVLLFLTVWAFSVGVVTPGKGAGEASVQHARIAIVDEDSSALSQRIAASFYPPYFLPARQISIAQIDPLLDGGEITFVLVIPEAFERDLIAGKSPRMQLLVDATRIKQAGIGAGYVKNIVNEEIRELLHQSGQATSMPAEQVVRTKFNPNLLPSGFQGLVVLINNSTLLIVLLTGAAVIRERERGTIEHALAMPITPFEIMLGKIWAMGLVILSIIIISLNVVVKGALDLVIAGSFSFLISVWVLYLFAMTSIGIFLATVARSMPQMGLLAIMVVVPMNMLSGNNTPLEAQPLILQWIMQLSPSTHFVSVAQAIVFRGAKPNDVWPGVVLLAGTGLAIFLLALLRFRRSMAAAQR